MGRDAIAQFASAVAAVVGPMLLAVLGYALWQAKRRRVERERRDANRLQRRESAEERRQKALADRETALETVRAGTLRELEDTLSRVRAERDALVKDRAEILREREEADERALRSAEDAANVRTLAQSAQSRHDLERLHLERESDRLRRARRELWDYAVMRDAQANTARDELVLVLRVMPDQVRAQFPAFASESLRVVPPPPASLAPEPEAEPGEGGAD